MIVSVDDFKAFAKIDYDDEDALIWQMLEEAQSAAEDYCRCSFDVSAPKAVIQATKMYALHTYEQRDNPDGTAYRSMLQAWQRLLYPHREIEKMF